MILKSQRLRLWGIVLALTTAIGLTGCDRRTFSVPDAPDPEVIAAQNGFGFELYRKLISEGVSSDEQGIFISPASISLALSMTYNGARGETKAAMARTMGLESFSPETVNGSQAALVQQAAQRSADDQGIELRMANGLWQDERLSLRKDFVHLNQRFFGATVRSLDFDDPAAAEIINQWVSENTEGRIPRLLHGIDPQTVLFIVNAVYFKGDWTRPFDPHLTRTRPFYPAGGGQRDMPMMYQEGMFSHHEGPGFQAVRLPYGDEESVAMYVFLPDLRSDLDEFHERLTYDNWEQWLAGFSRKNGRVMIPRFRLDFKTKLNEPLKELGMAIAFDPARADFSAMADTYPGTNLSISEVIHQSFLLVNEEGTEAAAATSVGMRLTSAPVYQFDFIADRPFFLVIRDELNGAILFMGSVLTPAPAEATQ
ncbi:MAG: serpin family protein [Firmicutes bacterium]|jgi:serpin B|nr:serpin family protein [Bacillota bacterium]